TQPPPQRARHCGRAERRRRVRRSVADDRLFPPVLIPVRRNSASSAVCNWMYGEAVSSPWLSPPDRLIFFKGLSEEALGKLTASPYTDMKTDLNLICSLALYAISRNTFGGDNDGNDEAAFGVVGGRGFICRVVSAFRIIAGQRVRRLPDDAV